MPAPSTFVPYATTTQTPDPQLSSVVLDSRLSRTSYYDGRLLKATDLTRDQQYLDARLREMGRALGHGVVRGLGLTLDASHQHMTIGSGIAITPAGRTLYLDQPITVDFSNRALLQSLNRVPSGRLPSGLYAVVLSLAEGTRGIAEVFPADLAARRQPMPDLIVEGVALDLVKLDIPMPNLPEQQSYRARAQLAYRLTNMEPPQIADDGVALGVLAVQSDRLIWLDAYMLRHPPRTEQRHPHSEDLAAQYMHWFNDFPKDIPRWAARDYFGILPPLGPVPKGSIDPVAGAQSFFPKHWTVHVAPLREDDWEVFAQEALMLEPLDLASVLPAQVLVVARLDAKTFAELAPKLLARGSVVPRFAAMDPLMLRFSSRAIESVEDADSPAWASIWHAVDATKVWFVRRAPRATTSPTVAMINGLDWSNLKPAITYRLPQLNDPSTADAQALLLKATESDNADLQRDLLALLLAVDRRFDDVLWQTAKFLLSNAATPAPLAVLAQALRDARPAKVIPADYGARILEALNKVSVTDSNVLVAWQALKTKWQTLATSTS